MRYTILFITLCLLLATTLFIGLIKSQSANANNTEEVSYAEDGVPSIGKIQVLNGIGITGAANTIAEQLRKKRFDVKNISNAKTWNYPVTLVISRTKDLSMAQKVAQTLKTDKIVMIRNSENLYDVTVIIGNDFVERLK